MKTQKKDKILLQENIERKILYGLACEWDAAASILPAEHRNQLKRPFFRIVDLKNKLGYWAGAKREIGMNRHFVLNYPWDCVRDVLRHEMAHQFTETVLGVTDGKPHGAAFIQACKILRADPAPSSEYISLHERLKKETLSFSDKMMIRIKKLMALAESQNRHEAEAAMVKAHALIEKYNLDLLENDVKRNFVSIFVGDPALRHFREEYHLAHLLQDFYFIQGIWVTAYVLEKGKMGRVLEISGTLQNVKIAEYVYTFVNQYIRTQWSIYKQGKKLSRYRKTDFAIGIIEGFRDKLESERIHQAVAPATTAPVKVEDPLLIQYMNYRYPHTRSFRRQVTHQDVSVLKDGIHIGKKMVISKGITERKSEKKILPE